MYKFLAASFFTLIAIVADAQTYPMTYEITPIVTCGGTFYDSGGADSTYSNYEEMSMAFESGIPGMQIQFIFNEFTTERYSDRLTIYDGPNTGYPVLGEYSGLISPNIVSSSNGSLTFKFHSSLSNQQSGWAADISCAAQPTIPSYLISNPDTVFTCGGFIYDSGGSGAKYSSNENYTKTFVSTDGGPISLDVFMFETEFLGSDRLKLNSYYLSGNALVLQGVKTFNDGYVTLNFKSDNDLNYEGFAIRISCPGGGNAVQVTSFDDTICKGNSTTLYSVATGGTGTNYTYSWYPQSGLSNPYISNPIASPTVTTTYMVTVYNGSYFDTTLATITVLDSHIPTISILPDTSEPCTSQNKTFTALTSDAGNPNFEWYVNGVAQGVDTSVFEANNLQPFDTVEAKIFTFGNCYNTDTAVSNFIIIDDCLGVDEQNPSLANIISIYPNPSNGSFELTVASQIDIQNIEVLNAQGQTILIEQVLNQNGKIVLDLGTVNNGLYFLKIGSAKGLVTKKVMVLK